MMRIAIPLALPALLSAALIAFVKSIEMFGIPGLIGRPAGINVLTTYIWASLNEVPPSFGAAAILSIVILLAAVVLLWVQGRFTRIGERFVTFTGKGGHARTVKLGSWRYVAAAFAVTYLVIAVVLPYVVILYGAFVTRWGVAPVPSNFTFDHFIDLFTRSDTSVRAIRNSVLLGIGGATIAVLLASLVSYIITKTKLPGRRWLEQVAFLPLAIPGVVLAVGLIWGFIRPPFVLYGTVWILLLGYVIRELPIGSRIMNASLLQIHKDLESAAVVCGAGLLERLRAIFLPLARSGLVAGWMLLFVAMIRDLSLSMYLYSFNNEVIAVSIFNHAEDGQFNLVYVMAFILAAITLASLVALTRIVGVNPARMR